MERIYPEQYFETSNTQKDYTLYIFILAIIAALALGLAIGAYSKK